MARVDLVEPYAIRQLREMVRDSLRSHGEEVVVFRLFHPTSDPNAERCWCYDEVYKDVETKDCPDCVGTGFQGGVKDVARIWAMFTASDNDEEFKKSGQYQHTKMSVQMEGQPTLMENDILARVLRWSNRHEPLEVEGFYILREIQVDSLRTGNDPARVQTNVVGQKSRTAMRLDEAHPIYKAAGRLVPSDKRVPRLDGLRR
jgi:hypothetical protein